MFFCLKIERFVPETTEIWICGLYKGLASCFHSGMIHLIGTQFVVKGLLDKSYGRLLSRLFELRQSGDYDDLYDATEDEVIPYIDKTFQFIQDMEKLIVFKGE